MQDKPLVTPPLRIRLDNARIILVGRLRRWALRVLFGKNIVICTCGAVCDFDTHRKDHFYCGHRLNVRLHNIDQGAKHLSSAINSLGDHLTALDRRITEVTQSVETLSEVEKGHAMGCADRLRLLRHRIDNAFELIRELELKVDTRKGLEACGDLPAYKVQQLIERYKIIRSYVRGISERQRTIERALSLSVSLDGPQRFKDEACELLISFLEECKETTTPLLVTRTVHLLDRSGYHGWNEVGEEGQEDAH